MNNAIPRVIAFDLDDTLYLERDYVRSGFHAVGEYVRNRFGYADFSERCWSLFEAGRRGKVFDEAASQLGLLVDDRFLSETIDCYRAHTPLIQLLEDAAQCLKMLRGRVRLALITDGYRQVQHAKIKALGLEDLFDHVRVTDDWGRDFWKPHVRAFDEVRAVFHVHPGECVYVGDNPHKDFRAPTQLGWSSIRVRRAAGLHANVSCDTASQCDRIAFETPNLSDLVERLFSELSSPRALTVTDLAMTM